MLSRVVANGSLYYVPYLKPQALLGNVVPKTGVLTP